MVKNKNIATYKEFYQMYENLSDKISSDKLDDIGYSIVKSTDSGKLHIISNNKDYFVFISPKSDDGYSFWVGNNHDPMYHQTPLDDKTFLTLDEVIDYIGSNFNGNSDKIEYYVGNPPGW